MLDTKKPGAVPTALLHHLQGGLCLTADQMAEALGIPRAKAIQAASKLIRRDYLAKMAEGCFQLTDAGVTAAAEGVKITSGPMGKTGAIPAHTDTFRQRAWASMRFNRRFTIGQIVRAAAREGEKNARENARKFIGQLCRAGIVRELPNRLEGSAPSSPGFKRFDLAQDLGRKAPVYRAEIRAMHDFNSGRDLPCVPR